MTDGIIPVKTPEELAHDREEATQRHVDTTVSKFLGESVKDGIVVKKDEEPVKPIEPVKTEEKPQVVPPIDTAKLRDEITKDLTPKLTEEISAATTKRLIEALTGGEVTKGEQEDILANAPWVKENRNPSWAEAMKYVASKSREGLKEEIMSELEHEVTTEEETQKKQEMDQKAAQETNSKNWGTYWQYQLKQMEDEKVIPTIINKDDKNDPGILARQKLVRLMETKSLEAAKKGEPIITDLWQVHTRFYKDDKVPGADAPIAGTNHSVTSQSNSKLNYTDMHKDRNWIRNVLTGLK